MSLTGRCSCRSALSFSCSALLDQERRATTDSDTNTDLLARCGSKGFGVSTTEVPTSATFTLVQNAESHTLVLDDIDTVDKTADDDCHEPAPSATVAWPNP